MKKTLILAAALCVTPMMAQANAIPEMLELYKAEGGSHFNAAEGKKMWSTSKPFTDKKGVLQKDRTCATCHGTDLTKAGKHAKTGKVIAPLAPSVPFVLVEEGDVARFTVPKKIKKWFKRNCKWTYGRECTAQEKGDFLMYIKDL